ncbi:methyl-accepting chemotaxis protein, partial [Piscinibacter sakaiensis]|uniref:methyl-accepting chemotaxis protein n=1 Tax=Piscinibacter sakaiensis TaxID=1547922 RepID=UPI0006B4CF0F
MPACLPALSIRRRLQLATLLVAGSLLALGAWGAWSQQAGLATVARLFDQAATATAQVAELRETLARLRRYEAHLVALGASNAVETERVAGLWRQAATEVGRHGEAVRAAHPELPALEGLVAQQRRLLAAYRELLEPVVAQLQAAQIDSAVALAYAGKADDTAVALERSGAAILAAQQAGQAALRAELAQATTRAGHARLALIGLVLALVLPLMAGTLRSVGTSIDRAVRVADRIAAGDLGEDIVVHGRDETARLLRALHAMQQALRDLVGQVRGSADAIQGASRAVAGGNGDLNDRTARTAEQLRRAAGEVGTLAGTVAEGERAAREASGLAAGATVAAQRGGESVARVVRTMQDIDAGSRRIADIVGTIDGIA